jgi:DNA repair protein RecN (Recombination protein N)
MVSLLTELSIRDIALIDKLRVGFQPGLNVLSGETGAGKSLLVGTLGLLCGDRASANIVRSGARRGAVEGIFALAPDGWIARQLAALGIELEDGELILRREIVEGGKGRVRANGAAITLATLARAAEWLVDLHGQHEHQSLLRPGAQLDALDEFAGLLTAREEFGRDLRVWQDVDAELRASSAASAQDEARRDLARFQLKELEQAAPQPGEFAELGAERRRLEQAEFLQGAAARLVDALSEADLSVRDSLHELADLAAEAAEADASWSEAAASLRSHAIAVEEVAADIRRLGDGVVDDPERLAFVRERLRLLSDLLHKYGPQEDDLFAFWESLRNTDIDPAEHERHLRVLRERAGELSAKLAGQAADLTRRRRRAGRKLARRLEEILAELGMAGTRFEVRIGPRTQGVAFRGEAEAERAGRRGVDNVEYLIAPNRGEESRPLRMIASGGEISRVMLALKSAIGQTRGTACMVFDEIDIGVGGRVASRVARLLGAVAAERQVICITHLAPIASQAKHHLRVFKEDKGGRTVSRVEPVVGAERVEEIARMLGGEGAEGAAKEHARELLREARS